METIIQMMLVIILMCGGIILFVSYIFFTYWVMKFILEKIW